MDYNLLDWNIKSQIKLEIPTSSISFLNNEQLYMLVNDNIYSRTEKNSIFKKMFEDKMTMFEGSELHCCTNSKNYFLIGGYLMVNGSRVKGYYSGIVLIDLNNQSSTFITAIHQGAIRSIAVSTDEQYIASCSFFCKNTELVISNIEKSWMGNSITKLNKLFLPFEVTSVIFSHDNKYLLTSSKDGKIRFFDITNLKKIEEIKEKEINLSNYQEHYIEPILFLNNDKFLVFGIKNGKIRIWSEEGEHIKMSLDHGDIDHDNNICRAAIASDGSILALGLTNGCVELLENPYINVKHNDNQKKALKKQALEVKQQSEKQNIERNNNFLKNCAHYICKKFCLEWLIN